ncbi:endonuclease/exonuclease/phosphatase family protein [Vineibacter terrae]|uniref:endonuclease/exonuclease/phosphatase family protein n=1 Tax=Vineibacter terrae TaxID=2586908 RepID=UPI0015B45231|nr:endonuclease/exonuclease/phosphatase family protein [Vineibacter terrae]
MAALLHGALLLAAGGVAAATVAGFIPSPRGWLDIVTHFRPHLAAAALLLAIVAALLCVPPWGVVLAAALAVAAAANLGVILAQWPCRAAPAGAGGGTTLTVGVLNVRHRNTDHARIVRWIRAAGPDVLVLVEVSTAWADALEPLADLYPHRAIGRTAFVTMIARRPWTACDVLPGPRPKQGLLQARFDLGSTALTVIAAHPASPTRPHRVRLRDAELAMLAALAAAAPGPVAALGDFNATPWSAPMRRLVRASPLRYAGLAATTWPAFLPRWLGLKIDHIMLGNGCAVVDCKVGPDVGSDHRPVVATIRCPPP